MSIDQAPVQRVDVTDTSKFANLSGPQQTDSAQTAIQKTDHVGQSVALVKDGVLPNVMLHENQRHENGEHHGHRGGGKHHEMGGGRLQHEEFKKLSPDDKEKFKAENGTAREFRSEMAAWKRSGKTGPEPTRPELPEHEKLKAKVKEDREAIAKSVRSSMTPEELAAVDKARADFKQSREAGGHQKREPMPPELKDYEKKIGATTRDYLKGGS